MAAYAALVSLMHTVEQIEHHPWPPISLDEEQVESLTQTITFLQEFLEAYSHAGYSREGADSLESRIAEAAYAAEDMIESHIVDRIHEETMMSSVDFYEGLRNMIRDMDSIKNEVMEIIEERRRLPNHLHRNSSISSPRSSRSTSAVQTSTVVGFDDLISKTLDKVITLQSDLQIIRVVGMGGIGKTTLAQSIYENQMVVNHFDIRSWVTVSQDYRMSELVLELLQEEEGTLSQLDEDELRVQLYKKLIGRRYLIIIDDIWNDEVWNYLKFYLPDNKNESRIIFTTRISNLGASLEANISHSIKMDFLDKHDSWNLFCKVVFGNHGCPQELEEIGREIAESCKGLPLSINVIGGLLGKARQTQQHWQYVAENLNSIVNLEDGEYCLQILYMSYNNLPVYLKPCFLYMGVFGENTIIRVAELVRLWDAEGFLKPNPSRSLEVVAERYIGELMDRNLILVVKRNYHGKLISFRIHELLRDLCLREARKQKFLCILGVHSLNIPQDLLRERRICIQERRRNYMEDAAQALDALKSTAFARSLIWENEEPHLPTVFRLLRVYSSADHTSVQTQVVFQRVNLRYVNIRVDYYDFSFSFLWNLQTLIVHCRSSSSIPPEIWKMPRLRHVKIWEAIQLPDPPTNAVVLENLRELLYISNFKCSEEVAKRIPNIKRLKVSYGEEFVKGSPDCFLHNLSCLHELESFGLRSYSLQRNIAITHLLQNLSFPHSLQKLTLEYTLLQWEDMTTKIGSLPLLRVLKLKYDSFIGPKWETAQGQFLSLRFFVIERCHELESWITDRTHFPCLEHLVLRGLQVLKEIPSQIGEIATLKSIQLFNCSESAVYSAIIIRDEQEQFGNDLQVHIPIEEEEEVHIDEEY